MAEITNTKQITKNTLMLYFRQILIMLVSLYTVRVVLNVLGDEDYGIYNVVAGVVTMFNFLSNSMATASQRYFSFDLGKKDTNHLKVTFAITYEIYLILILIVVILAETVGLWFVNNKLIIPEERMIAANWIFQASIVSFAFTLITTPYMAAIIAHERMNVYAYVSLVEVVLKLLIVFLLRVLPFDKLQMYGLLLLFVAFINTALYRLYSRSHFEECKVKFIKDIILMKEIMSYSLWNLFGSFAAVCKGQLTNIVLNIFFGPIVNAARAVSSQVNHALAGFAQNFSTAMRPQVIKTYAANQKNECYNLVYRGCKFTFFLMFIFACPLFFEMDFVLKIWLKNPPELAVVFTKLILIESLIETMSYQLMTLSQATGKIKLYQGVVGGLLLLNLPVSYIVLKFFGGTAISVSIVSIVISIIALFFRLILLKKIANLSIKKYFSDVIIPCLLVTIILSIVGMLLKHFILDSMASFFMVIFILVCSELFTILLIGLTKNERKEFFKIIQKKIKKDL